MMVTRPNVDITLLTRGRETSLRARDHDSLSQWMWKVDEVSLYILHQVVRLD
jgi:hypothetical protein